MKTTTTGFEKSKVNTYLNLLKYFNSRNDAFARHDYYGYLRVKEIIEKNIGKLTPETRILEIGCGQRFARTMLFHSEGANITGIDLDFVDPDFSIKSMVNIWRINGFERFIKTIVRHFFYDRKYYTVIEQEYGKPLKWSDLDVRRMSAYNLDFPSNYFDFIFSNAVFEHMDNIDAACGELARVLKPEGYAYCGIHLYPSLSGGHNLEWAYPDEQPSKVVPPWDHLRKNRFPAHVYLNKLKKGEYVSIFNRYCDVHDIILSFEGESLLTNGILSEISGYSKEDLITRSMELLVTKKH